MGVYGTVYQKDMVYGFLNVKYLILITLITVDQLDYDFFLSYSLH